MPAILQHLKQNKKQFCQDGSRAQTARKTLRHLNAAGVFQLVLPARSSDLNPIDGVWAQLKRSVCRRPEPMTTYEGLKLALLDEWNKLSQETVDAIVLGFRSACQRCIDRGGQTTGKPAWST